MLNLIYEYKQTEKILNKARETADPLTDKSIIGGMISDVEYAMKWMQTGRNPDSKRGAERTRVYAMDPAIINNITTDMYNDWERKPVDANKIDSFLSACLTKREEEVYRLYIGEQLSLDKIAQLLNITKSSVQKFMDRANDKIEAEKDQVRFDLFG